MRAVAFLLFSLVAWAQAQPLVAVAPALDRSGSGLLGVEFGLSEMVEKRLGDAGFPVLPSRALDSWRLGQGILIGDSEVWKAAAKTLGADFLVLPSLESLRTARLSLALGPLLIEGTSASSQASLTVWDLKAGQEKAVLTAEGTGQGQATPSFRLFLSIPWDVCLGGLRLSKGSYLEAEPVLIGYLDPMPPNSFYLVIHPQGQLAPAWTAAGNSTATDPCVRWTWDQRFGGVPAGPGPYQVDLYDSGGSLIATITFEIEPTFAGWATELSFGAPEFLGTAWYQAIDKALTDLFPELLPLIQPASL